ncbi:MAG: alpha/beta hydrolase [Polyangia bacterium]|jgi:pimeloyl-ACP methyl ester carboxylesterase|nr:alpha/beta hydrolase [Polyangia bacterium]
MPNLPRALPELDFENRRVETSDRVSLAVQVTGSGPSVLLANGIGVTRPGLDFLAGHLASSFQVICWDYRGAGESRLDSTRTDLSIERHALDAREILEDLGVRRAAVLGWSMGVPVGLELIRSAPEMVAGFGALFGAAGRPFEAGFGAPLARLVHLSVAGLARAPAPGQLALDAAVALPSVAWALLTTVGFVGPGAHRENFDYNVRSVANADRRAYFTTLLALSAHDAHDVLPGMRCPALVVAGKKDPLTPVSAARRMVQSLPDAELVVLPDASHFGVIEHGPALWEPIDRLLHRAFHGAA